MSIATEAKDFVAYIRDAKLAEEMPTEFMALADAVDSDSEILLDALITMDAPTSMLCPRCGQSERMPIPCEIRAVGHWFDYFRYAHARCKKP